MRPRLWCDSTSKAYDLPQTLLREAQITRATPAEQATRREQIAHCRALLASDPLIGAEQRSAYEAAMHEAWMGLGGERYLPAA